ncbi:MAG: collagen binding domain-containing protein, partial [Pirellula sp.]
MSLWRKTRSKSAFGNLFQGLFRRSQIETLEPRVVFNGDALGAKPLWVGGVYVEEDSGSDAHGDSFYVTFEGGVANTRLNRLVIDTDQNATGYSVADNLFDTLEGNRGADHAYGFKVESLEAKDPEARVWAEVLDGSMQLVLNFENFYAGDRVVFSIDVDEVQHLYSTVDIQEFNEGLDPITSGAEFEGSMFRAEFSAPHYENSVATGRFFNRYDSQLDQAQQAGSPLDLPADNADGKRDRSSGAAASTPQILIPASIAGKVYLDNNDNGIVDNFEKGLGSVTIELVSSQTITGESIRKLVTTQADGTYRFDSIPPGLYSLFELQPAGLFDGQDSPGRVGDQIRGSLLANDRIGNILLNGGDVGVEYNFGELEPSSISGKVHIGLPGFSCFSADPLGSRPLADVTITLVDNLGKVVAKAQTDSLGAYRFDGLPKGLYTIVESQPVGLIDGSSRAGTVEGATNGVAINGTRIESIRLLGGQTAIDYDFCERLPSSISGKVYEDIDQNGAWNSGDSRISGVQIDLLDRDGKLLATTTTQADGSYRFEGLAPGSYTVVERQPEGYFQAGQQLGSAGGNATTVDTISSIVLTDGLDAIDYDFLEIPPGIVSGYVFQDGSELLTSDGQPPGDLTGIRDGVRTPDDLPIAGSVLQLRKLDGSLLSSDDVLPGRYGQAGVEVMTDATGFYRFEGVRPGKYHIYQRTSASNLSDGWDTPGTTGGYAINAGQSVPNDIQETIDLLATEQASDPGTDALLFVQVVARGTSFENNFSEILVGVLPPPPPPPP